MIFLQNVLAALPRGATGLSVVCDSGISSSYSLTITGPVSSKIMSPNLIFFHCGLNPTRRVFHASESIV